MTHSSGILVFVRTKHTGGSYEPLQTSYTIRARNANVFLAKGYSMRRIAKELGRSASTISRELKRNTSKGEYLPVKAEARYHKRRKKCRREKLLTNIRLYALVWDNF